MKALVYKSTGSWYRVRKENGIFANARLRGKMKTIGMNFTNPVAVGDQVMISEDTAGDTMIEDVADRKNYFIRESPKDKNTRHILAANVDQAILMASLRDPVTSTGFIDRFLVVSNAYDIPTILLFNKSDIYREKEKKRYEKTREIYGKIGYQVFLVSIMDGSGLDAVREKLSGKQTLIGGHSGVGKSSFINHLIPQTDIRVQSVSGWSGKGLHTTTSAEMHDLPFSGRVIDTPGIRELALTGIEPSELSHYFREMTPFIGHCRFNNCQHREEPGCAVKKAVKEDVISTERFVSYLTILDSMTRG